MQRTIKYELDSFEYGVLLRIRYDEIVSTDRIKMFAIDDRKCRFDNEITSNATFYPKGSYTKNLCLIECRIKAAIQMCGCRPFFYKNFGECAHLKYLLIYVNSHNDLWMHPSGIV